MKVFPCYATADRPLIRDLAEFLERNAPVEILCEEGAMQPGEDLIAKVEEGLSADIVLAFLSPESVPPKWPLDRWKPAFYDHADEVGTLVATVLCRESKFPELLRRKNFFDLSRHRLAGFRAIKRWLMSLSPLPDRSSFAPAHQPNFQPRDVELETLCTQLADAPGISVVEAGAGAGKTALALEFARRHREDFDAVLWLTCGSRTAAALAGDLAAQLSVRLDRDLEHNLNEIRRLCARHRCLLVLDDASPATALVLTPRGRTSVLLTTRHTDLAPALGVEPVPLHPFPLNSERLAENIRNLARPAQRLLSALCACAPSGPPIDMAVRTADAEPDEAREIIASLISKDLLAAFVTNGTRCLVSAHVRERISYAADGQRWSRHHARAVADLFGAPSGVEDLTDYWPDLQHAFAWAIHTDWTLASTLARRALIWAKAQDRLAESFEILLDWRHAAEQNGDRRVLEDCAWEQIWILEHWGRTEEARELDTIRREQFADQMAFSFDQS